MIISDTRLPSHCKPNQTIFQRFISGAEIFYFPVRCIFMVYSTWTDRPLYFSKDRLALLLPHGFRSSNLHDCLAYSNLLIRYFLNINNLSDSLSISFSVYYLADCTTLLLLHWRWPPFVRPKRLGFQKIWVLDDGLIDWLTFRTTIYIYIIIIF